MPRNNYGSPPYDVYKTRVNSFLVRCGLSADTAEHVRLMITVTVCMVALLAVLVCVYKTSEIAKADLKNILSSIGSKPFEDLKSARHCHKKDPVIVWYTSALWRLRNPEKKIKCPNNDDFVYCHTSSNKSRSVPADAYLFYGPSLNFSDVPLPRNSSIIWGLFTDETPKNVLELLHERTLNLFNFSATCSRYSDAPIPLTWLAADLDSLRDKTFFVPTYLKNNRLQDFAPILYIQSNCAASTERDAYVQELMKYISVDSYGRCLNNRQMRFNYTPNSYDPDEYLCHLTEEEMLRFVANYKFMITIDSVVCKDYVSEKLWRALRLGVVPIYFGSPTIRSWLPNSKSAVLIEDYPTPELLAKHLHDLNQNDTAYEEHLLHKTKGSVCNKRLHVEQFFRSYQLDFQSAVEHFECLVCRRLHRWNSTEVNIVTKRQYNCSQSISALTRSTTTNETALSKIRRARDVIENIYRKSLYLSSLSNSTNISCKNRKTYMNDDDATESVNYYY